MQQACNSCNLKLEKITYFEEAEIVAFETAAFEVR